MRRRNVAMWGFLLVFVAIAAFVVGELTIRLFSPTESLYPRYAFSKKYGLIPFPGVTMVHTVPGKYRYEYTINSYGCRGQEFPDKSNRTVPTVVVLGDSYSFGMGVSDGDEYAAVMSKAAQTRWRVLNLSCPGWGLTQQIRRYNDIAAAYHPSVVILQFCGNDPEDDFIYRVTTVEDGHFVYRDSDLALNWSKKFLSRSIIQRSQLYNFFRARGARAMQLRAVRKGEARFSQPDGSGTRSPQEAFYCELLDAFADQLSAEGVTLLMVSVTGQLDRFKTIRAAVEELAAGGRLTYLEVADWLDADRDYASPEGHQWGREAHAVIGRHLAGIIDGIVTARASGE